jgi:hypothetical protein
VQRLAPELREVLTCGRRLRLPASLLHHIDAVPLGLCAEDGHDLVQRLALIERQDQRLHDRRGAVVRPRVAPLLEEMRRRHVPLAELGRLVVEKAYVDACADLLQGRREIEIHRRGEGRVHVEHHEQLHLAAVHVGDERGERRGL